MSKSGLLCALFLWVTLLARAEEAAVVRVAAASDLQAVMPSLVALFRAETGYDVKVSFGGSAMLYRQIQQGAPFSVFLSADADLTQRLLAEGLAEGHSVHYASGRLALVAARDTWLRGDDGAADLREAQRAGLIQHFAIAHPLHAPYGRAAQEALEDLGLWDGLQLVRGENVAQALQFVLAGAAQGGIVASALLSDTVRERLDFRMLSERLHDPLAQHMVALKGATDADRAFIAFLQSAAARSQWQAAGFTVPQAASKPVH